MIACGARLVARTERPLLLEPSLPPLVTETSAKNDQPTLNLLLTAVIACPHCHMLRYMQPVRVVAETSMTVAKPETTAPELISICPRCSTLAVVAFFPTA